MADRRSLLAAACGALSLIVLASMLVSHAWPLWTGESIYLRVRPVDPRDLFRGDYVVLAYEIDRLALAQAGDGTDQPVADSDEVTGQSTSPADPAALRVVASDALRTIVEAAQTGQEPDLMFELQDRMVCVQLEEEPSPAPGVPNLHAAVRVGFDAEAGRTNLCGRIRWPQWGPPAAGLPILVVDYGLDALFVPEGSGAVIERAIREGKAVFAEIAVTESGRGRLKDLIIDGRPVLAAGS